MSTMRIGLTVALLAGASTLALAEPNGGDRGGPAAGSGGPPAASQRHSGGEKMGREGGAARSAERAERSERRGDERAGKTSETKERRSDDRKERAEAKQEKREKRAEEKRERREDRAERKEERTEKRAERKEEKREDRADRNEEKREERADKREDKAERQENRAERRDESRESTAENREQRREDRAEARDDRRGAGGKHREARKADWDDGKRKRFRQAFRDRPDVHHYDRVDVDIYIGSRLPSRWDYYDVPTTVIDIAPRYRGYRYAYVEDRYVIVEPDTYEVVAYVDTDSGDIYLADAGSASCGDLTFAVDDRRRIFREIDSRPRRVSGISVGIDLDGGIELSTFPSDLRSRYSSLADCRYVRLDDDRIAIVPEDSRKVVAVITN